MSTAAVYVRLSQIRKGEKSVSMQTQEADCRVLAERLGYAVEVFSEPDKSASSFGNGRPVWDGLLRSLDRYDAVIGWKQDRFARDEEEWHGFVKRAGRAGVRIITVADGTDIDPDDPELLGPSVKSMVAAQESRNTSKRVKRALAERAERGDAHGGRRRYGYRREPIPGTDPVKHCLVVVDEEADIVRDAARRVLAGESLPAIVNDLNARRVGTVTGKPWGRASLRGILTGPTVTGRRTLLSEQRWSPILDDDTAAQVRARLISVDRGPVARAGRRLLRGFALCGLCGTRLVGASRTSSGIPDYCCPRKADGGCGRIRIAAAGVEDFVRDVVITAAATSKVRRALEANAGNRAELADLTRSLRSLERRADQIAADYGSGALDRRTLKIATESNNRERADLERRVSAVLSSTSSILADAPRTVDALRRWWDAASDVDRRALVGALLERVEIGPGRRGPNGFQRERVDVTWRG